MNYDFYDDLSIINGYVPKNKPLDLFNPYEAYLAGNIFKNEYIPYKNYKVRKINITSEQEEMLFNISNYCFLAHDMNLYLDVYPNNQEALDKFNEYRDKVSELTIKYERKYGPLEVSSVDIKTPFSWVSKWPLVN